jgi:hypothetical protein
MRRDGHLPNANSADDATDDSPSLSSSQPPASYADNSSTSHSNSQHDSHNMSRLAHAGAGSSFAHSATAVQRGEHFPQLASLIPRSALQDGRGAFLEDGVARANSLLDREGHRRLAIDITLGAQSSHSMDVIHDGKFTALVARFEASSGSGHSDAFEVSLDDQYTAPPARHGSIDDGNAATVRMPSSPRKPIPSQWLPLSSGPKLATAQRAKERGHNKGSINDSPIEAKIIRGTCSLADISGAHGAEGASFLTKTAYAAVDSDLTPAKSPVKGQRTPSKPAWNSPKSSPRRENPQQKPNLIIKTSPIKKTFLSPDSTSYGHQRGTSVATSTGDSIYHSAESSPVRSDSPSLMLTVEYHDNDDDQFFDLQSSADSGNEQMLQRPGLIQMATKAATVGRGGKPSLRLEIPYTHIRGGAADEVPAPHALPMSSFGSPHSGSSVSRIPRVVTTNATSAHSPTRSSTLKATRSVNLLTSPKARLQSQNQDLHPPQPSTPPEASVRHVRTVNSSGATPILSVHSVPTHVVTETRIDPPPAHLAQPTIEQGASHYGTVNLGILEKAVDISKSERRTSRESNTSTVKPTSGRANPVLVDPAIVYSKRSGASGTALNQLFDVPQINVSLAHDYDTGVSSHKNGHDDAATAISSMAHSTIYTSTPVRGRSQQPVPNARRQEESEHSLQSSVASDLRATAPEFVPHPLVSKSEDNTEASSLTQIDPTTDLLGPIKYELDMYGIPWYYYMYQVQFAYDQGFQKGRSKASKKTRQKKHRSSVSSPVDAPHQEKIDGAVSSFITQQEHQVRSEMPPPASTVPLAQQRAQSQRDNSVHVVCSTELQRNDDTSTEERPFSPFAAQKEMIDRQCAFRDFTVTDRLPAGIDLTTIRNVGLPQHDYSNTMPYRDHTYNNPRRHNRNDNGLYSYRGRGAAGVRMQDTAPFPNPVPPQGRPANSVVGTEACGTIDIVYAAERIGGEACHDCEPDHPLEL